MIVCLYFLNKYRKLNSQYNNF